MPPVTADHAFFPTPLGNKILSFQREEWPLACVYRPNVLFVGPKDATRALLDALRHDFREPVFQVSPRRPPVLPDAEHVGTIILEDVATLGAADQRRLLDWLNRAAGRPQVISTASAPILPMIVAGAFAEALYYRLNMFYVDLAETPSRA